MRPRREGTTLPRQRCPVQACNCLVALPATESLAEYPPCYIFELGPSKRIFRDSNPDLRCVTITLNTRGSIANRKGPVKREGEKETKSEERSTYGMTIKYI
jgi:hypothetical protein